MLTMAAITRARRPRPRHPRTRSRTRALAYLVVVLENTHDDRLDEDVAGARPSCSPSSARSTSTCCRRGAGDAAHRRPREGVLGRQGQRRRRHRRHRRAPRRRSPSSWPRSRELAADDRLAGSPGCGHAGDGNVHLSVFQPDPEVRYERAARAVRGGHGARRRHLGRARHRHREAAVLPRARGPGEARPHAPHQGRVRPARHPQPRHHLRLDADRRHDHERRPGPHPHARRRRRRRLLHEPGHLGDALRRRARRRPRDARRARRCSKAWPPAPPTATAAWPTARRRRCCTSAPGLGNGLANLHNARRAHTPIVNIVGDHATYHKQYDAPLESDIETRRRATCRAGSARRRRPTTSAADAAEAVAAAHGPPGQVATLILPADVSWLDGAGPAAPRPVAAPRAGRPTTRSTRRRQGAALAASRPRCSRRHARCARRGLVAASRDRRRHRRQAAGRDVPGPPRARRRASRRRAPRLPRRVRRRSSTGCATSCSSTPRRRCRSSPIPDKPSDLVPDGLRGARARRPAPTTPSARSRALADAVGVAADAARSQPASRPDRPTGALTAETVADAVGALLPEGAIVVRRGATRRALFVAGATAGAPPPRLADPHRRRDRPGLPVGDRRRGRVPRPQGRRASRPTAARCTRCSRCGRRPARASTSPP